MCSHVFRYMCTYMLKHVWRPRDNLLSSQGALSSSFITWSLILVEFTNSSRTSWPVSSSLRLPSVLLYLVLYGAADLTQVLVLARQIALSAETKTYP